ncbi:HalOD1 output domain-containing protein [Natronococcus jeotgali]|uniref:Halobacterial output domain-containing protein n=1 Tax=Natronococcus jeotgali DSM 18795 TaxID=1227498 RepID=L9XPL5_9EURY|nr:HalOD1 output domain-containing protein [Natronococcus jeotgali]ELY63376.1 hypothetical protein C492_07040 [Natronococcus jeotgali DSM 18795]
MTDEHDPLDGDEPVVQTRYSCNENASEAVIRALAVAEGVKPTELDLLYESIDPEALNVLLGDPVISDELPTIIKFSISDYRVIVSSNGRITIL